MADDESQSNSELEHGESSSEKDEEADEFPTDGGETERMDDRPSDDDYDDYGSEEQEEEDAPAPAKKKKPKRLVAGLMEYDIEEMYPEIDLLISKKKQEWDFQDPAFIRALWLETKTNILADWRMRFSKFKKSKKPTLEVRNTLASTLRKDYTQEKAEQTEEDRFANVSVGNDPPVYKAKQLPTNLTMEVRYNFVRNNPPVPRWYVEHFQTYKKPPFHLNRPRTCNALS